MIQHIVVKIESALQMDDDTLGDLLNINGAAARSLLQEKLKEGHVYIGSEGCEGFDPVEGCPGHYPPPSKEFPNSSNIACARYDEEDRVLQVQFKNGGIYKYEDVPAEIWGAMCEADSVGSFLSSHIRGKFKSYRFG